ncbi:MAG: sigma 54-interacting transcriptional regulator [Holophagales bacterium]|nr:sigma 54-interacting transcriptional regulator [Holophagales bacterium]
MRGSADRIEHPTLEPAVGRPLHAAELSDRARLAVLLQAAALLSLLERAAWRLERDFARGHVTSDGVLTGLAARPGRSGRPVAERLVELVGELFEGGTGVAGRGEARRAARALLERWRGRLVPLSPDEAVTEVLEAAPFLSESGFAASRAALEGVLYREGREIPWRAGRRARSGAMAGEELTPSALVAAGKFARAARRFATVDARGEAERLDHARALFGLGRAEAALAVLEGRCAASEALRLECQLALGQVGAARETLRRFEQGAPSRADRFAAAEGALRVLAHCGERDAARDWASTLLSGARGAERFEAQRRAAQAAYDRGDREALERHVASARELLADPDSDPRFLELAALVAFDAEEGPELARIGARRLATGRRRMGRYEAGRAWNQLGLGRQMAQDLEGAERAFRQAVRLLRRCDGPLGVTLAACNLAEVRLRRGRLDGVEAIVAAATVANLRSGIRRAQVHDEALWARLELSRGELEACAARVERARAAARALDHLRIVPELDALGARAHGWLGREDEAARCLGSDLEARLATFELEERPFVLAFAGRRCESIEAAEASPFPALARELVRGGAPPTEAWTALDALEPYRRARYVLDAERLAPGSTPRAARAEAAAIFRRVGASRLAELVAHEEERAWRALKSYCASPAGDPRAVSALLASVGHPEATLLVRGARGERVIVEGRADGAGAELIAPSGDGELVLRAEEVDEPLRAVFALLERDLPGPSAASAPARSPFVGASPVLAAAVERLARFGASDLPVLLLGENGTGKELAAELIHRSSARSGRPWVPVNCAGLPETLIQSHLFGHVRGAFTGADRMHVGFFERAQGSTLFLDEIGDLPAAVQGNLLRALQEGEILRLGESVARKVDVRIVAATNRDLERMVEEGKFREDLYYRLKVATVVLPPLRERGDDVLLLAEHFLGILRGRRAGLRLAPDARRKLRAHAWPGNVRELRHALEAAAELADGDTIAAAHLELAGAPPEPGRGKYHATLEEERRRLVVEALRATAGNKAAAARRLGMTRQNFSYLCKKLGVALAKGGGCGVGSGVGETLEL